MNTEEYRDYVLDILAPFGEIVCRRLFGGHSLYKNGIIFAFIADDILYFKVGDSNRRDYEENGSEPFVFEARGKKISLSYWQVPLDVIEDGGELMKWAEKSYRVGIESNKKKNNSG